MPTVTAPDDGDRRPGVTAGLAAPTGSDVGPEPEPGAAPTPWTADADAGTDTSPRLRSSPLVRQLPFVAVAVVVGFVHVATDPEILTQDRTFGAFLLVLAATTTAAAMPWHRLPTWAPAVVPVLDILAVALLLSESLVVSSMLVLPVMVLARTFPRTGVAPAIALGVAAAWSPEIVDLVSSSKALRVDPITLQRLVIIPAVLASTAIVVAGSERRSTARLELVSSQSQVVEEALADSRSQRRLLEAVLNTVDVGVVVLDAEGRVTLRNRTLVEQDAPVPGVGELVDDPEVLARHDGLVRGADGVTELGADELPSVRVDRGERVVREIIWWGAQEPRSAQRVSATRLTDESGAAAGSVLVYQDLTKEMEALAQRDDFVSSVTHELRTPLTSILGYLDLALEDPDLPDDVRTQLDVAVRNSERLELLISNLLVAARESAGATPAPTGLVDLSAIVADVAESQAPRAADGRISVEVDADERCEVEANETRLTQIVDNLVSNAIKYSRPGDRVRISTWRTPDQVHLEVVDTGIGISAGDRIRLFSRFYRAPSVRSGPVQGTGLGLHITKGLVEALGGTITLESRLGEGTTVEVSLPAAGAS
ncbi:sensor histidine kinase [Georgenia sp. Z1344]|uniref:sensor histidine kinase n=1 Tax=Georgenia sp. Z1344 TaxID=3416706 RepID=UPI003CEC9FE5